MIHAVVLMGEEPVQGPAHSASLLPYDDLWGLAARAWCQDPSNRPPMSEIVLALEFDRKAPSIPSNDVVFADRRTHLLRLVSVLVLIRYRLFY